MVLECLVQKAVLLVTLIWRDLLYLHLLRILWSKILLNMHVEKTLFIVFWCVYIVYGCFCVGAESCGFPTYPQPYCFGQWVVVQIMFCSRSLRHTFLNVLISACISCKYFKCPSLLSPSGIILKNIFWLWFLSLLHCGLN